MTVCDRLAVERDSIYDEHANARVAAASRSTRSYQSKLLDVDLNSGMDVQRTLDVTSDRRAFVEQVLAWEQERDHRRSRMDAEAKTLKREIERLRRERRQLQVERATVRQAVHDRVHERVAAALLDHMRGDDGDVRWDYVGVDPSLKETAASHMCEGLPIRDVKCRQHSSCHGNSGSRVVNGRLQHNSSRQLPAKSETCNKLPCSDHDHAHTHGKHAGRMGGHQRWSTFTGHVPAHSNHVAISTSLSTRPGCTQTDMPYLTVPHLLFPRDVGPIRVAYPSALTQTPASPTASIAANPTTSPTLTGLPTETSASPRQDHGNMGHSVNINGGAGGGSQPCNESTGHMPHDIVAATETADKNQGLDFSEVEIVDKMDDVDAVGRVNETNELEDVDEENAREEEDNEDEEEQVCYYTSDFESQSESLTTDRDDRSVVTG